MSDENKVKKDTKLSQTESIEAEIYQALVSRDYYNLFLQEWEGDTSKETDGSFPTYEEYVATINKGELFTQNPSGEPILGKTFNRPNSGMMEDFADRVITGAGKAGIDILRARFRSATGMEFDTAAEAFKAAGDFLKGQQQDRAQRGGPSSAKMEFPDRGDGGVSEPGYSQGSRFNPGGLSLNLPPKDVRFDTDIRFPGTVRYFSDGQEKSIPLIMKGGVPLLINEVPGAMDQQVFAYFTRVVTDAWNSNVSAKVTWTNRVQDVLTTSNLVQYYNNSIFACAVYYFYRSIIVFTNDERNRNAGMDALADALTPSDYNQLFMLRKMIMSRAIPPFIHKWTYWMYGNYRQNHLPTSPLMKICPWFFYPPNPQTPSNFTQFGSSNNLGMVQRAIEGLDSSREISNVLSKAIGNWLDFEPYEYTSVPEVDPNWTTFFTNASYKATHAFPTGDHSVIDFPLIPNGESEVTYNLHTDAPDGWLAAMLRPTYQNGDKGPGLFGPETLMGTNVSVGSIMDNVSPYGPDLEFLTSCYVFTDDITLGKGFKPVELTNRYQCLAGNTYTTTLTSNTWHAYQKFGTERCILLSPKSILDASLQFLDLAMVEDIANIPKAKSGIVQGKEVRSSRSRRSNSKSSTKNMDSMGSKEEL